MIRREIRFKGRVQHVGFRYTASALARENRLTGWVRNEHDGSVYMAVQGEESGIDRMLLSLMNDRFIRIDSYDVKHCPVIEGEKDFSVRR